MIPLGLTVKAHWRVECWRPTGHPFDWRLPGIYLAWVEEFDNLVVTEGRNTLLDRTFKTVPANVNWFVGLKGSGAVAAGDTMASHAGWAELTPYANATRPAYTPGSVASGSVDNGTNPASFSINATATISGAFMSSDSTKGGTSGLLYGAGDFAQARQVQSNDVLNVKITLSVSAS